MECSICYSNISNDQLNLLSCAHYFHNECIQNWINTQTNLSITPTCPICRCNTITNIIFDEIDDLPPLIPINDETYDDLPPLIPLTNLNLPLLIPVIDIEFINMLNTLYVSIYSKLLYRIYNSSNADEINNLTIFANSYKNKYQSIFENYLNKNLIIPSINLSIEENESMNNAKSIGFLPLINWWINKSNTDDYYVQSICNQNANIIACQYSFI